MLTLQSHDMQLVLAPQSGGSIASFTWRAKDILRPHTGQDCPTSYASFPLIPFCNRIAHGRISYAGEGRTLSIGSPALEPDHALHGIGWISPWAVREASEARAILSLRHDGALWPWRFEAEQSFELLEEGFRQTLSITNGDTHAMPTGLGFHPYFPRENATIEMEARGVWRSGKDRLPERFDEFHKQPDWFHGAGFDDCLDHPARSLAIQWPTHRLTMSMSANLPFLHLYTPPGEPYFCVEPVSHIPDAVNSPLAAKATGLVMLRAGETMRIECLFQVEGTG